jgi:hypothetical protein
MHRYAPREAEARAARVGLWSQPEPVPPWEWRRGQGVPQTAEVIGNRRSHVYQKPNCREAASMCDHPPESGWHARTSGAGLVSNFPDSVSILVSIFVANRGEMG